MKAENRIHARAICAVLRCEADCLRGDNIEHEAVIMTVDGFLQSLLKDSALYRLMAVKTFT